MADRDRLDDALATLAVLIFGAVVVLITGYLLDPNDYPRDRPPPKLAMYATCPVGSP